MERKKLTAFVNEVFVTSGSDSEWFGYYNYDTLNHNQTKLLCNKSKNEAVAPEKGMTIELGYYDIPSGDWHHIGESDSWNWQQGCMMQWLPGDGNENKVIYNTSRNNHLISVIHDISTGEDRFLNWSIYGLTPDGKKSIALNMERSYWCRAYHYQSVANKEYDVPIPEDDGIFEIDLDNNTRRRIVDIHDVIKLDADANFSELKHWLEHIMISPSGKRFCFLHRYSPVNDTYHYQTRLCVADVDGQNLQVVSGWRDYGQSHFGWRDDDSFCIYSVKVPAIQKNLLNVQSNASNGQSVLSSFKRSFFLKAKSFIPKSIIKKLKGGDQALMYQFYQLTNGVFLPTESWRHILMNIDGHPSFTNDGDYMLTDTYADNDSYRRLLAFNPKTGKCLKIASLYEPLVGNPARCDLHPKLCKNNNYIVVDTTNSGKHQMIMFKLNWDLIKQEIG